MNARFDTPLPASKTLFKTVSCLFRPALALVLCVLVCGPVSPLFASSGEKPKQPLDGDIVPDKFLRRWDPVTIFFEQPTGKPGPEDNPERFVSVSPEHPGAFTWLDSSTLQFRPAEPWPPLTKFEWKFGDRTVELDTLMSAPVSTHPADNASGLAPVESFTMTFPEPLEREALERMIAVELRPVPGMDRESARWLDRDDFELKISERMQRSDRASYVMTFEEPIPMGIRTTVHLRLSLSDRIDEAFREITFSTDEPFRITGFGSAYELYPVTRAGVSYDREQALRCPSENRTLQIQFSSRPDALNPVKARNLVRFSPAVDDLGFNVAGESLTISGNFQSGVLYKLTLEPIELQDIKGRNLKMDGPSTMYFHFLPKENYLNLSSGRGILERYGPQMIHMDGRGFERLDVRIHAVDPLDRSFWPFPGQAVEVDEDARPPAPGEAPEPYTLPERRITVRELSDQIKAMGSPSVSTLREIPLRKKGSSAKFGLDLKELLEKIHGKNGTGAYLVGIRKLDGSNTRSWMRVQVTDLCLTAVEEPTRVRFATTSLASGAPLGDVEIRMEGYHYRREKWETIFSGKTGPDGSLTYNAPGSTKYVIRRIVAQKDGDMLVLDPSRPMDRFYNNLWARSQGNWLQWTQETLRHRGESDRMICHIFTERPVYKPDEPVHVKGYLRQLSKGKFHVVEDTGYLVVEGPGDLTWHYELSLTDSGSFYHKFEEEKLPTGRYRAWFEFDEDRYGSVTFRKEAYRLPKFEVQLHGPETASLDEAFGVKLTANYYAGGKASERPVRWRVTQFPFTWIPEKIKGFYYSTDARFSGRQRFESTAALVTEGETDGQGGAEINIDPTIEPTAQPRTYVVEATVTGADDQTVTNTKRVNALPPFTLGMKVPRYIKDADRIEPEIIVVGPKGNLLPERKVLVRVLQRQWHSHLQAGDFTQNKPKYVTDVVDEKIFETEIVSGKEPAKLQIPIEKAGVYVVRLEARDKTGRTQVLSLDLFAGGKGPVTWSRPPARVLKVTPEKKKYNPGDTAKLVVESPFQNARALAVVEPPNERNIYKWIDIRNGTAVFELPIKKEYMPQIPVHFILMRGRLKTDKPLGISDSDLGKPVTLAATRWVKVSDAAHRIKVDLKHPSKALPGQEVEITISLSASAGAPVGGEVTLWLVDQAVLSLGKEQRIDPLPTFISNRKSHVYIRDTRNMGLGFIPFKENPGGDSGPRGKSLLDKVTIRKNFKPVPYYNPAIIIGEDGTAKVLVKLPDNLTNFKIRAKAVSGPDLFGYAKSAIAVRLPVIVQPVLPRFVRPGDSFSAAAVGRIVEGDAGPGAASIRVDGLELDGPAEKKFEWPAKRPVRISYEVRVSTPGYTEKGEPVRDSITVVFGVERDSDKARDAFSSTLPIRADRKLVVTRALASLEHGSPLEMPEIMEEARKGTLKRSLLVSKQPALVRMAAGLDYLMEYPHGCTEQLISRARAQIASKKFRDVLYQKGGEDMLDHSVNRALEWIDMCVNDNGRVSYWPGAKGYVSLTAWTVQFLVEARAAGYRIDSSVFDKLTNSLKQSLRSDYSYYIDGEHWAERCWALAALSDAGLANPGYAAELARKSNYLNLESKAQVALALARLDGSSDTRTLRKIKSAIWDGIVIRLYQGREIYGGLQEKASSRNALILPTETRTLAEVVRAVSNAEDKRLQLLVDALVTLGRDDGWGSTNANSSALLALSEFMLRAPETPETKRAVLIETGRDTKTIDLESGMKYHVMREPGKIKISVKEEGPPLAARMETAYLPLSDGSMVEGHSQGFVVTREMLRIKTDSDAPPERVKLEKPGNRIEFKVGDIVEEHIELVNPKDRHYVAVAIPLAAGMEPLNPALATAPPEARPSGVVTLAPSYTAFMDDQTAWYYDTLPKGTYHFYFRAKAMIPGVFVQPAAYAEMMYDQTVNGNTVGATIAVLPKAE